MFYFDATRCIGCKACQMACKELHGLGPQEYYRRVDTLSVADSIVHYSGACNHCADAPCLEVCPMGALYRAADDTVQIDRSLCIGCGACARICPYGAVFVDKAARKAKKCDACISRRENGLPPACVTACPMRALQYGDEAALRAGADGAGSGEMPFLPAAGETNPRLCIRTSLSDAVRISAGEDARFYINDRTGQRR